MAPVTTALENLLQSLAAIGTSILNSIIAVFQAFFALGVEVFNGILHLAQAVLAFGADLFGSVLGFVAAHFVALAVIGGVYYWYTSQYRGRSGSKRVK